MSKGGTTRMTDAAHELWVTLKTAAARIGCSPRLLKRATQNGELRYRVLESSGQGEPRQRVVVLKEARAWHSMPRDTDAQRRTAQLLRMFLDGDNVSTICQELRMKRGAVLRALQRQAQRDPDFPVRDRATDRATGARRREISVGLCRVISDRGDG